MAHHDGLPYEPDALDAETRERLERERQARVHQEAHEPTGDWVELADDPDAKSLSVADLTPPGTYRETDLADDTDAPRPTANPSAEDVRVDAAYLRGVAAGKAQVPPIDYPVVWNNESREAERRHRERMANISADEAFRRGVVIGRAETEAEAIDGHLLTSGPSDYEVWRDAVFAANTRLGNSADRAQVVETAEWLWQLLQQVPVQQGEAEA
jgi:hypothetical protein